MFVPGLDTKVEVVTPASGRPCTPLAVRTRRLCAAAFHYWYNDLLLAVILAANSHIRCPGHQVKYQLQLTASSRRPTRKQVQRHFANKKKYFKVIIIVCYTFHPVTTEIPSHTSCMIVFSCSWLYLNCRVKVRVHNDND